MKPKQIIMLVACAYAVFAAVGYYIKYSKEPNVVPQQQFDPDDALMVSPHGPPITWDR